jgi:hypothetical protein
MSSTKVVCLWGLMYSWHQLVQTRIGAHDSRRLGWCPLQLDLKSILDGANNLSPNRCFKLLVLQSYAKFRGCVLRTHLICLVATRVLQLLLVVEWGTLVGGCCKRVCGVGGAAASRVAGWVAVSSAKR